MAKAELPTRDEILGAVTPVLSQARSVRFQEVDAAGTIFFPRVLEYFGDAYQALLVKAGIDLSAVLVEQVWAAPLVHAEADFLGPLRFGDAVTVEIAVARLGRTSVTLGHRVIAEGGTAKAVGVTVHVFVDGKTFVPIGVPEALRRTLEG